MRGPRLVRERREEGLVMLVKNSCFAFIEVCTTVANRSISFTTDFRSDPSPFPLRLLWVQRPPACLGVRPCPYSRRREDDCDFSLRELRNPFVFMYRQMKTLTSSPGRPGVPAGPGGPGVMENTCTERSFKAASDT